MKIINKMPLLISCLEKWKEKPSENDFNRSYMSKLESWLAPMIEDFSSRRPGLYHALKELNWNEYRSHTLKLKPDAVENNVHSSIEKVENLLDVKLQGEVVIFGAFCLMDGYARFDQGTHRVFLGLDENHHNEDYLNILTIHELTHVARESQPTVWQGLDLDPKMTHQEFQKSQTVLEHLFSEGYSCAVSEILHPTSEVWNYGYQTKETLIEILEHAKIIDRVVHAAIDDSTSDYRDFYNVKLYNPLKAHYSHYVWAWQWVKHAIQELGDGYPKALLKTCSEEFRSHAQGFELSKTKLPI